MRILTVVLVSGLLLQMAVPIRAADETESGPAKHRKTGGQNADLDFGPYMAALQERVKHAWYPPKGHEDDQITVDFQVSKNGHITDLKVLKGSGYDASDEAALKAVHDAAPFRGLPKGSPATVDVQFTFDYKKFTKDGTRSLRD